jgi:hypothetical protein
LPPPTAAFALEFSLLDNGKEEEEEEEELSRRCLN